MSEATTLERARDAGEQLRDAFSVPDRLNLGSGEDYRDGWHNVDINPRYDPDEVVDLNDRWPWADDSFASILASHVFEHLDDLGHAFGEAARVLAPGGKLVVKVPTGINATTDATHRHRFTWDTFLQFARNWRAFEHSYQFDPDPPLELVNRRVGYLLGHGPGAVLAPVGKLLARVAPGVWVTEWPMSSAELVAVYRGPNE